MQQLVSLSALNDAHNQNKEITVISQFMKNFIASFPKFKVCFFFILDQFSSIMECNILPLIILFYINFVMFGGIL